MDMDKCVKCGGRDLTVESLSDTFVLDGVSITTTAEGLRCGACGESYLDLAAAESCDRQAAAQLVRAGIPGRRAFKLVRKHLGYTGAELGALLDVAPETVSRWETGEREIPRYARALLALLALDQERRRTEIHDVLTAVQKGRPLAA
jgi:putative zinc finger/helix-turn-helix YgiT family protein